MNLGRWVLLLLLVAPVEELVPTSAGAVDIAVPKSWKRLVKQGTLHFGSPAGDAYLDVDVGSVQTTGMSAQTCVDKIVQGIGGKEWRPRTVGEKPAALKVDIDTDPRGKQFVSYTYVGCDGFTTWALSFHWVGARDQRYSPLAESVASSLKYRNRARR